jgi:hypothetical protein
VLDKKHSAKLPALGKGLDSGSDDLLNYIYIYAGNLEMKELSSCALASVAKC